MGCTPQQAPWSPRFSCGPKHKAHHTKQWRFNLSFDRQPVFHCESHLCERTSGFLRNCSICVKFLLFPPVIPKIIFIWEDVLKTIIPCTTPKWSSLVVVEFNKNLISNLAGAWSLLGIDNYLVEIVSVCQKTKPFTPNASANMKHTRKLWLCENFTNLVNKYP